MWFPSAEISVNPTLLLLLGVMVGTLSGFFGVGGGFLITGGLLVFGVPPVFAVGTGLALIMGSSIINTLKHRHLGNVDLRLGLVMLIGTIPGVYLAEQLNSTLEESGLIGPVIRYVYIVFLAALGGFIVYDHLKQRRTLKKNKWRGVYSSFSAEGSEYTHSSSCDMDTRIRNGTNLYSLTRLWNRPVICVYSRNSGVQRRLFRRVAWSGGWVFTYASSNLRTGSPDHRRHWD